MKKTEAFATVNPGFKRETLAGGGPADDSMVNHAIRESTGQYERMQQAEAAGRLGELEQALRSVNDLDRRRAALFQQAVHDLRTNGQSVRSAAQVL